MARMVSVWAGSFSLIIQSLDFFAYFFHQGKKVRKLSTRRKNLNYGSSVIGDNWIFFWQNNWICFWQK